MALTAAQAEALVAANPFVSYEWFDYMHDYLQVATEADSTTAYQTLLFWASEGTKFIQYLLNTDDEELFNPMRISGQVLPAANTVTALEAPTAKLFVAQLVVYNAGADNDTLTIYHVKAGAQPGAANILRADTIAPGTDSQTFYEFNLPLRASERLMIKTTSGLTTVTSYVY